MPPSILDGRALATTYEYADGQLVRSVQEAAWTDRDRALILALTYYRNTRLCPACGGLKDECGPKSRGQWRVPPPRRCYRADRLLLAQEGSKRERPDALSWTVEREEVTDGADGEGRVGAGGRRLR